MGFPGGSVVKNRLPMQETQETQVCTLGWQNLLEEIATYSSIGFNPWVQKFPGEGKGNPLQYSCLENPMDRGAWYPLGHKESDTTERLHFLSSILAWENPCTEGTDGLQSMESLRVRHDSATEHTQRETEVFSPKHTFNYLLLNKINEVIQMQIKVQLFRKDIFK